MKTPIEMYDEGWCKDCDYCFKRCQQMNKCKGFQTEEEEDADGTQETIQFLP